MQTESQSSLLAELLCAKLCHDLAGAVGAVTAGAELLADEGPGAGAMAGEALDLMAASAAGMAAKLRFLRLALGPANSGAAGQARGLAQAYFSKGFPQGEWRLDWPESGVAASPEQAKLLLNLICLAQDCLPRGGDIVVRPQEACPVTARGKAACLGESAQALSATDMAGLTPRAVQGFYLLSLAQAQNLRVAARQSPDGVDFSVEG